ncbi:T9SS type B sorting domain-containing protein [Flavobacterium caeni]|uniref:T9SS type B sorting domain-containing protein n=1 Tax=Flavobacterium caeni TaxID=490189 RepID=UPI001B8BA4C1|nr:choice-of-anchor L domain-containing protein [Flavobacterium caeni]
MGAKAQYIQVDDTYTAAQLVSTLLSGDPCSNAANMTVSGDTFSAGQQSFGYFSAGTSSFPFANGIVLATSRATRTEGPNNNLIDEGSNSWGGDTDLEQALGINNTVNATVLEFDFIPYSSHISFDYIFSSEEYHGTATCTYSDGFAFLLKEAGSPGPYQNLALIPNTTTPVLVTSVHPEIPGSGGCPAQNELYFDAFNGTNHPTNFNGQTVPMTAQATVVPGNSYHIKIVIADHENIRYDSAIFLSGGSFQADVDLGPDLLLATDNAVCAGGTFTLTANEPGTNTYKWFRNNVQVPGAFSSVFVGNTPGDYRVEITMGSTSCVITGEVTVEYAPLPTPAPATLVQCDEDDNGNTFFNLERAIDLLTGGDPDLVNVTFYETNGDAQLGVNWITNATNYLSIPKTIYARVVSIYGCVGVTTVTLQISGHSVYNYPLLETCDHDPDPVQDGFYHFTLSDADPQVLDGLPPGLVVEYYETVQDALLHPENVLPNVYYNTVQNDQTIFAKIINGPDCHDIIAVELVVNTLAPPDFEDAHISICAGESVKLDVNDIYESYTWSNGGTTASTTVTEAGIYTITVMENDCTATKTFIVTVPDAPLITNVEIEDMTPGDNTVLIQYTGTGNYEFSLDGVHFQDSPYFSGVAAGEYTVVVRDKFGCGATSKKISVFNFPRFFTPNGDGINDFWTVSSLRTQPNTTVSIFDRYGKLITRFNGDARGWDGKFHSKDLPSSDYWFVITLENGRNVKGHFSLVR